MHFFLFFFATPSGLSSFFAFWGLSFSSMVFTAASLCRLFLFSLCSNDIFVSLTSLLLPAVLYLFLLLVGICYAFYSCIHSFLAFFLPFLLKKCPFLLHISQKSCTFAACNPLYISIQTRNIYDRYTIHIR